MQCSTCGINFGTPHTLYKHKYLTDLIHLNNYDLIIDACAGAGRMVLMKKDRSQSPTKIVIGSAPLIERVKKRSAECIFIEYQKKTYELLKQEVETDPILGDCNNYLLDIVDNFRKTLVFVDPNGYGVCPINRHMIIEVSQRSNTDLLIHFSQRIYRNMGYAVEYENSTNKTKQKRAERYIIGLNIYWGGNGWRDLLQIQCNNKELFYAESYAEPLYQHNKVDIIPVPLRGRVSFFLILATKFEIPPWGLTSYF